MQHARRKSAKVSTAAGSPTITGESVQIEIAANDGRIVVTACDRDTQARTVELDLSRRAAARLGRALVRKDAEIVGLSGVRPIVTDSLALVMLQDVEDALCAAQEKKDGDNRHLVEVARSTLRAALCRIETGASHG